MTQIQLLQPSRASLVRGCGGQNRRRCCSEGRDWRWLAELPYRPPLRQSDKADYDVFWIDQMLRHPQWYRKEAAIDESVCPGSTTTVISM